MKIKSVRAQLLKGSKNRLVFFSKVLLATGLIIYLSISGNLNFATIMEARKYPVFLFSGVLCCNLVIVAPIFRWWILSKIQKLPLGGFDAVRLTMVGYFFNMFIPGGTGGDVVRALNTVRDCPERKAQALTIAFVDRGLGLHALLLLGVSMVFVHPMLFSTHVVFRAWFIVIGVILAFGTIAPLLLVWNRTNGFMLSLCGRIIGGTDAWREAMMLYRQSSKMVLFAYFFSLCSAVFNVLAIHFMVLAVGSFPTITESLSIAPLVILANTLPISPGGVGVAEGASAGLYAILGISGGANGMVLLRIFIIFHSLLGLPFYIFNKKAVSTLQENEQLRSS